MSDRRGSMSDNAMAEYVRAVYAGVLGKVIGVYMGRPIEGWTKSRIEQRWGQVDRYINADFDPALPLVVSDDDISGTLTFVRALEDSGLYADTPVECFGDTWLNYLIEERTVLWWGGLGMSTEHTAYLRLKSGILPPASGSMKTASLSLTLSGTRWQLRAGRTRYSAKHPSRPSMPITVR